MIDPTIDDSNVSAPFHKFKVNSNRIDELEEDLRELYITQLKSFALNAADEISLIQQVLLYGFVVNVDITINIE